MIHQKGFGIRMPDGQIHWFVTAIKLCKKD